MTRFAIGCFPFRFRQKKTDMTTSKNKNQTQIDIPDKILDKVSAFPSMPKAGMQLRSLLGEKDVSIDEIEKILCQDPGLAANVLRLANSAFFGVPVVYAEKEDLKIDHAEIGALILNKWSFPDEKIGRYPDL